ncbi:MAG: hypothetical protein IPJ09_00045 [Saprospiraceae bacterium]|nr:hypothetical protein [Saprospiraceae bacterium]
MNYSQGIITKMAQKNYALMKPDMNINPFEIISNQIADLDLKLEKLYEKLSIQPDSSKAPLRLKAAKISNIRISTRPLLRAFMNSHHP